MTLVALAFTSFGVIMILLASFGLIRFPDVYMRSHAAGKAATLGVCCVMFGAAFGIGGAGAMVRAVVTIAFLFVTIPVGAQLIARAALRNNARPDPATRMDRNLDGLSSCASFVELLEEKDKQ